MCDYSIQNAKTRPAAVDDKLVVTDFGMTTRGFAPDEELAPSAVNAIARGAVRTAVCLLPGTELAFDKPVQVRPDHYLSQDYKPAGVIHNLTARFRQVNKESLHVHHDALEFGSGQFVLLTQLLEGQRATVLQLPAAPQTKQEAEDQTRVVAVG